MWATAVIGDGPETGAVMSRERIKARELNDSHVGRFISCVKPGFNYGISILKVQHFDDGVGIWYHQSKLPDGSPERRDVMRVPFDQDVDLVEMIAH